MEFRELPMEKMVNNNVLVTGGTGFVGSHLCERLVEMGANVTSTYLSLENKSYFISQKLASKVDLALVDLVEYDKVLDLVTKKEIDFIFHLGAQAIVETAYYNPRRTFESNIMGTVNVLESARLYPKVKGIVIASSDKAYGKLNKEKYLETDPLQGDHPYDVSKSATDLIGQTYFKTYGLPVVITRFGNIYGEGDMNMSRIIPGMMQAIIRNEKLNIRSNGKYIRDYLYVKDVVEGYLLLASKIEQAKGQVFNFGSSEKYSVIELVKKTEELLGKKIAIDILNNAKNEIPYQSLDDQKIKEFGCRQKYNIEKTLAKIFSWYKSTNNYE